jgi:hypothetical protein
MDTECASKSAGCESSPCRLTTTDNLEKEMVLSSDSQFSTIVGRYLEQFYAQLLKGRQLTRCEDQFVGYITQRG